MARIGEKSSAFDSACSRFESTVVEGLVKVESSSYTPC